MFLLDEFQKRRHIRSAEMVHRFQSGKHAHFAQSLEVIFTNVLYRKRKTRQNRINYLDVVAAYTVLPLMLCKLCYNISCDTGRVRKLVECIHYPDNVHILITNKGNTSSSTIVIMYILYSVLWI